MTMHTAMLREAASPNKVRRLLGNPWACRMFFLTLALMEIADLASDVLWLLSVVTYDAFHESGGYDDDTDDLITRYDEGIIAIVSCTVGFFALSVTLLFGKLCDDLQHIFASDVGARHPHKRLEVFGLSVFYLLTMSNEEVAAAYSQRNAARDAEQVNLWDSVVGLHRPDNHLDEPYPLLAAAMVPRGPNVVHDRPPKLWEVLAYPVALTFSEAYFLSLPAWLACLLWPLAAALSVLSMVSLFLVGLGNMFTKSRHSYTIRIFEDVPQFAINVAYLASPFGRGRASNVSLLSLALSGVMLVKFAVEVGYEVCTSEAESQLAQRRVVVPRPLSAAHTLRACFVSPIIGVTLTPFLLLWIILEGLASFVGGLCGCSGRVCGWAPAVTAYETTREKLAGAGRDVAAMAQEEPLLPSSMY